MASTMVQLEHISRWEQQVRQASHKRIDVEDTDDNEKEVGT
jgi:hypothetical protein